MGTMFRGRTEVALIVELEGKGWPSAAAREIAAYLVGKQNRAPEYRPDYWERRQALKERRSDTE
jgi:hypothetical protein